MSQITAKHDLPIPAGATDFQEWRESPNGLAVNRRFQSRAFPVYDWLTVTTGGIQLFETSGVHTVVRTVGISIDPGCGQMLVSEQAIKVAATLTNAVAYVSELEKGDQIAQCPLCDENGLIYETDATVPCLHEANAEMDAAR